MSMEMTTPNLTAAESADLKTLMDRYERELIQAALRASGGHQRRAAACLGVLPTTLHEKMKRLGLLRRAQEAMDAHSDFPRG
jgi:DNA-binding NtrC family response regulator